jgi:protein arginine kinase activator
MHCQFCKTSTATIHLTEIVDGQRNETHLCEACAQKQGLAVKTQIPLNELLSSLLAAGPEPTPAPGAALPPQSCPHCGITFEQFRQSSLLGCPSDYEVFEKQLAPVIAKSHAGNTRHKGKVPAKAPEDTKHQLELLHLRQELDLALESEDYELAARIRDRIKKLQ